MVALSSPGVVQESTGFSPNDLVFGYDVRGPFSVPKCELEDSDPPISVLAYVNGFKERLYVAGVLSGSRLTRSQARMKKQFDRRTVLFL